MENVWYKTGSLTTFSPDHINKFNMFLCVLTLVLESKKHIYSATAEAIVGTCPDMCPEKERYLREVRRHLSVYEIVPGSDMVSNVLSTDLFPI